MANTYNLVIDQGADFALAVQYLDPTGNAVNLASSSARSMVRSSYAAPKALISLTVDLTGGENGYINLSATAANTANLPATNTAVWDLEVVTGNTVIRLLEGTVRISPEATR